VRPRRLFLVAALAVASVAHAQNLSNASPDPGPVALTAKEQAQSFSDRVVLAKPRAEHRASAAAAEIREGVRVRRTFARFGDVRVIELDGTEPVAAAVARLQATGRYEFVEPSYLQKPNGIPNDPGFSPLWHFNNTGQAGGTAGADIKAPAAWDVINDASGVIVAIIDTGARLTHPEIAPNLWRNPAPTFGDIHGARFTSGTGLPTNGDPTDDHGHGTRMAGCIGAAGNNNALITGVAWKVQMMILKNGDSNSDFYIADTVASIDYAIARGARIINCSFGTTAPSQALFNAIKAGREAGVIFVCAAGNDGVNTDVAPLYPAGYALDNIVTVAMSRSTDLAAGSFGNNVDLFSPGFGVTALNWTNDTGVTTVTGASPATAFVTGSFALLKARFPGDTYRQLINRLLRATDRKPDFAGKAQSGGRLNLLNAVTSTSNRPMNDDFASRAVVSQTIARIRSNNTGATTESGESALAGAPTRATLW
jgi:subtilisin family serine protease